jgi:hypothetical protein
VRADVGLQIPIEAIRMTVDDENSELRAAAREVLDIFDQGDTSEGWHTAMMKLRSAAAVAGPRMTPKKSAWCRCIAPSQDRA